MKQGTTTTTRGTYRDTEIGTNRTHGIAPEMEGGAQTQRDLIGAQEMTTVSVATGGNNIHNHSGTPMVSGKKKGVTDGALQMIPTGGITVIQTLTRGTGTGMVIQSTAKSSVTGTVIMVTVTSHSMRKMTLTIVCGQNGRESADQGIDSRGERDSLVH